MAVRTLTPLLGDSVLPDPWVSSVVEIDEAGAERVVLYMVGTSNEPMLDELRRQHIPGWSTLPAAEREKLALAHPPQLCPLYRSDDLGRTWHPTARSLFGSLSTLGYGRTEVWAPELHRVVVNDPDGTTTPLYICVYTTRRDGRPDDAERVIPIASKWLGKFDFSRHLVIGQMVSESITGPFVVAPEPLVDSFFGVLDAHLVQPDPATGDCWLLWKEDQTAHDLPAEMWLQPVDVTRDGLRRVGEPRRILRADPTTWHGVTVEGMTAFCDPSLPRGWIYLLFSGNECFNDSYGVGCMKLNLETGESELLPHPILSKDTDYLRGHLVGIGHPSIVRLPPGREILTGTSTVRHLLFAHAWSAADVCGVANDRRRPYVFGLVVDNGWPKVIAL